MFSLLAWLPDDKLFKHAQSIFARLSNYEDLAKAPELYIRLGDTAEIVDGLEQFYEEHLTGSEIKGLPKSLPTAAFCRAGKASSSTIDFMKVEFEKEGAKKRSGKYSEKRNESYHQALFLALMRFDEKNFVQNALSNQDIRYQKWYQTILDGKAAGQFGPNNCMLRDGRLGNWNPPTLQRIAKKF